MLREGRSVEIREVAFHGGAALAKGVRLGVDCACSDWLCEHRLYTADVTVREFRLGRHSGRAILQLRGRRARIRLM